MQSLADQSSTRHCRAENTLLENLEYDFSCFRVGRSVERNWQREKSILA